MHDFREETIIKIVFLNNGFPIYGYRSRMIYNHRVFCLYTLSVSGPFLLKYLLLIFEITLICNLCCTAYLKEANLEALVF